MIPLFCFASSQPFQLLAFWSRSYVLSGSRVQLLFLLSYFDMMLKWKHIPALVEAHSRLFVELEARLCCKHPSSLNSASYHPENMLLCSALRHRRTTVLCSGADLTRFWDKHTAAFGFCVLIHNGFKTQPNGMNCSMPRRPSNSCCWSCSIVLDFMTLVTPVIHCTLVVFGLRFGYVVAEPSSLDMHLFLSYLRLDSVFQWSICFPEFALCCRNAVTLGCTCMCACICACICVAPPKI